MLRHTVEAPGGLGDKRRAAMVKGRDGRAAKPAEILISDEAERELYLLAVQRHDDLGKTPDHICREAFVQVALEYGLQARGGGVVCSSRSMSSAVNRQVLPIDRELRPSSGGGGGSGSGGGGGGGDGGGSGRSGGGGGSGRRGGSWAAASGIAALTAKSKGGGGGGPSLVELARVAAAKETGEQREAR